LYLSSSNYKVNEDEYSKEVERFRKNIKNDNKLVNLGFTRDELREIFQPLHDGFNEAAHPDLLNNMAFLERSVFEMSRTLQNPIYKKILEKFKQ
jgi:hypothetical protein